MSNSQIITAWKNGNSKGTFYERLNTDGDALLSYNLQIGTTNEEGEKVLFIYTAKTGNYKSATTSRHCELVRRSGCADIIHEMSMEQYEELEELRRELPNIIVEQTPIIQDIANLLVEYVC